MSWFGSGIDAELVLKQYNEMIGLLRLIQERNTLLKQQIDDLDRRIAALERTHQQGLEPWQNQALAR